MAETQTRDDLRCPKSGEMIEIGPRSICRMEDTYFIFCPDCRAFHSFYRPRPAADQVEERRPHD